VYFVSGASVGSGVTSLALADAAFGGGFLDGRDVALGSGDIDGDGTPDALVGSPQSFDNAGQAGKISVLLSPFGAGDPP
jgi:hypothetical protein